MRFAIGKLAEGLVHLAVYAAAAALFYWGLRLWGWVRDGVWGWPNFTVSQLLETQPPETRLRGAQQIIDWFYFGSLPWVVLCAAALILALGIVLLAVSRGER